MVMTSYMLIIFSWHPKCFNILISLYSLKDGEKTYKDSFCIYNILKQVSNLLNCYTSFCNLFSQQLTVIPYHIICRAYDTIGPTTNYFEVLITCINLKYLFSHSCSIKLTIHYLLQWLQSYRGTKPSIIEISPEYRTVGENFEFLFDKWVSREMESSGGTQLIGRTSITPISEKLVISKSDNTINKMQNVMIQYNNN